MQPNRPQDRIYRKKEKPPTRTIQLTLALELIDALELMVDDGHRYANAHPLQNMITCALKWAVWAHSHGRGPDREMMEDCRPDVPCEEQRGYTKWNERLCAKREARELEHLYGLGDDARPGGSR